MTGTKTAEQIGALRLKHEERLRTLSEAKQVADEIGLTGQSKLYTDEIANISKRWRIDHEITYPEVTHADAKDAFCAPYEGCAAHHEESCLKCRIRDSGKIKLYKWELWTEKISITKPVKAQLNDEQLDALRYTLGTVQSTALPTTGSQITPISVGNLAQYAVASGLSNQLLQATAAQTDIQRYVGVFNAEYGTRSAAPIMYPMGAMLKLKDAIAKDVFECFECWRPVSAEEKRRLEDPWIVGCIKDDNKWRYFKIADWR